MDGILGFLADNAGNIMSFIYLVLFIVAGVVLIKILLGLLKSTLKKSKIDPTQHKFISSASKVILYILLVIIVLDSTGVNMQSIIAFTSVFGIAVSLALQGTLSNIASGISLLFTKPFDKGDYVQINGVEGNIDSINLTNTKLNTLDNKAIYIPNNEVASNKIINFTREDTRRLDLIFSISYNNDFKLAKEIILDTINKNPLALHEPAEPLVRVCEHGDSGIKIAAKVWVESANYWDLNFDLLEDIKTNFDANGIEIPYNQLDVFLKNRT